VYVCITINLAKNDAHVEVLCTRLYTNSSVNTMKGTYHN